MKPRFPKLADEAQPLQAIKPANDPLAGWSFMAEAGRVALSREYEFTTAEIAAAFLSFASGLAAVFGYRPELSAFERRVTVLLVHRRRATVTARELAFAHALVHLEASFHAASFAGCVEAGLTLAAEPLGKEPA